MARQEKVVVVEVQEVQENRVNQDISMTMIGLTLATTRVTNW